MSDSSLNRRRSAALAWSQRVHRRSLLRAGGQGLLGLSVPKLLWGADRTAGRLPVRAKSVIFLFQWGGPSHLDTFDMKPEAPDTIRSPYGWTPTSASGIRICDQLPDMAPLMHKVTLIRSVTHTMKNHAPAGYYALTGQAPPSDDIRLRDTLDLYPAYGSVVDHLAPNRSGVPTFVAYPHRIQDGVVVAGQHASFLGSQHDPFFFSEDPAADRFALPELSLPSGVSPERLMQRRRLQQTIDNQRRLMERSAEGARLDRYYSRALDLLNHPQLQQAFQLERESSTMRDAYGRHTYGQSCLLARRLVEVGVRFVTVYFSRSIGGQSTTEGGWDTHGFNDTRMYKIVDKYHLPITNQTLPCLLTDLEQRGLLDETLVVWMGEFGRTPKINDNQSRDHWPQCYTVLLAGGGVKRGFVYGASDAHGAEVDQQPVRLEDLAATIYYLMGIDPATEISNLDQRPLVIGGEPVLGVVA